MQRAQPSSGFARSTLALAVLVCVASPALFALAALGSKWGWWDWRFGLGVMTRDWGPPLAWSGMIFAAAVALVWLRRPPRWGAVLTIGLFLLPASMLLGLRHQQSKVLSLPAIYDVQTDWDNPIRFSDEALAARQTSERINPISDAPVVIDDGRRGRWAGMRFHAAQAEGYPDLKPLILETDAEKALTLVQSALRSEGLIIDRIVRTDSAIIIEGYDRTPWYGLIDDYAVRIQSVSDEESRIDMRSVSREGHIDLGVNAARIRSVFGSIASAQAL